MEENIEFPSFRKMLIDKFMKAENYLKVIDSALEGEKQDKNHAELVLKWKEIRYTAYKNSYSRKNRRSCKFI